eukprot:TRINITY_DN33919_c0_g1_i3.p1 TRINITY_DN33919_c0_g1~~TRINITY_DN33919_c0_g1_i3.p1  ORF type:complete len:139 (+),score=47.27 TRINITY_DN33919_c0_g1_i3:3-419(+)
MQQVHYKDDKSSFKGKLLADFANLASTTIDLMLLKGPKALLSVKKLEDVVGLFQDAAKDALQEGGSQERKGDAESTAAQDTNPAEDARRKTSSPSSTSSRPQMAKASLHKLVELINIAKQAAEDESLQPLLAPTSYEA